MSNEYTYHNVWLFSFLWQNCDIHIWLKYIDTISSTMVSSYQRKKIPKFPPQWKIHEFKLITGFSDKVYLKSSITAYWSPCQDFFKKKTKTNSVGTHRPCVLVLTRFTWCWNPGLLFSWRGRPLVASSLWACCS